MLWPSIGEERWSGRRTKTDFIAASPKRRTQEEGKAATAAERIRLRAVERHSEFIQQRRRD